MNPFKFYHSEMNSSDIIVAIASAIGSGVVGLLLMGVRGVGAILQQLSDIKSLLAQQKDRGEQNSAAIAQQQVAISDLQGRVATIEGRCGALHDFEAHG